jgi:hypothetical protein
MIDQGGHVAQRRQHLAVAGVQRLEFLLDRDRHRQDGFSGKGCGQAHDRLLGWCAAAARWVHSWPADGTRVERGQPGISPEEIHISGASALILPHSGAFSA